jgi:hypothetical protein
MTNRKLLNRSGLAAIAAVTALTATPALAQVADPAPVSDPAPIVPDAPVADTLAPEPAASTTTADPLAPAAAVPAKRAVKTAAPKRVASSTRVVPAPVRAVSAAPAPAAPAPAASTPVDAAPAAPTVIAPPVEPAPTVPAQPAAASSTDDMLPIAGAAGLGLLALAGAGLAMRRRRRDEDVMVEQEWTEPTMTRTVDEPVAVAPVLATAPVATSAFNWDSPRSDPMPATGLTRTELAYQGPTPDNPSLSLKKRLKRAAFFDQREREVAAGEAVAVEPTAGLPDAMTVESIPASAPPAARRAPPSMRMSFNRTLQPA